MSQYILADDLSGALETGAAFRANGWRAILPLGAAEVPDDALRVLSSETRNLPPPEAARVVRALIEEQRATGAALLFKKIDSTLRGPIGGELAALTEVLGLKRVLICPANPIAGRTIRDGVVRIHGVPLLGTDFRHDPYWPAKSSSALEILQGQGLENLSTLKLKEVRKGPEGAAAALRAAFEGGATTVLADAELQRDLGVIAAAGKQASIDFFVGSGGFAEAVAAGSFSRTAPAPRRPGSFASMLVIAGSRSSTTERQIAALARRRKLNVIKPDPRGYEMAPLVRRICGELKTHRVAVVKLGAAANDPCAAAELMTRAGDLVRSLAKEENPGVYFLTGGETAWNVCRALEGVSLEILGEIEPGVVLASLTRAHGEPQIVITKPGGFGREDLLVQLAEMVK